GVGRRRALRSGLRVDGARPATPLGREGAAREVAAHRSRDGADGGGQRTPDGGRGTHRLGGAHRLARRRLRLRPHGGIPAPDACGPPARWQHGRPALLRRGKDRAPVPTRARGGLMYDLLVTGGTVATATIKMEDAARIAWVELIDWLVGDFGFDRMEAYQLLTHAGRLRVGNMVDPLYSVVAKIERRFLPEREEG